MQLRGESYSVGEDCEGLTHGTMLDYDNSAFYYFMITMLAIYLVSRWTPPLHGILHVAARVNST